MSSKQIHRQLSPQQLSVDTGDGSQIADSLGLVHI